MTEALDIWARARGAEARVGLETDRLAVDDAMLHAAEARRRAGTTGDGDGALARVLRAQRLARKTSAEAERDALLAVLRARLGLDPGEPVLLAGSLAPTPAPPLDTLLASLPAQPSFVRADATVRVAERDESLQRALVVQVPRMVAGGGQKHETFAHLGVDVRRQSERSFSPARIITEACLPGLQWALELVGDPVVTLYRWPAQGPYWLLLADHDFVGSVRLSAWLGHGRSFPLGASRRRRCGWRGAWAQVASRRATARFDSTRSSTSRRHTGPRRRWGFETRSETQFSGRGVLDGSRWGRRELQHSRRVAIDLGAAALVTAGVPGRGCSTPPATGSSNLPKS